MIAAEKSPRFQRWFGRQIEKRLAAQFDQVRVHGLDALVELTRSRSVILVANHSAWWDPMMSLWLQHLTGIDSYAIMNGANLREHAYFARVGAIGVDLDDPRDGARFLRHGRELLRTPGRALWIFAQGQERPPFERPMRFLPGAAALARLSEAVCIPVGLRYVFAKAERPVAYLSLGAPLPQIRKIPEAVQGQVDAVEAELARIESDQSAGMPTRGAFEPHLVHQPGLLDRLAPWLLARWMSPPALRGGQLDDPPALPGGSRG